jgi:hypothetical protein
MKNRPQRTRNELRPEYDFDYSKAIRGKYYQRLLKEGTNVVVLEPDIAEAFRDSAAVNDVLRLLLELGRSTRRLTRRSSGRATKSQARRST